MAIKTLNSSVHAVLIALAIALLVLPSAAHASGSGEVFERAVSGFEEPLIVALPINNTVAAVLDYGTGVLTLVRNSSKEVYTVEVLKHLALKAPPISYPISGKPLAIDVDRLPLTRYVAIGSDVGELLVVDVKEGKPVLHLVQACGHSVKALALGNTTVAVLTNSTLGPRLCIYRYGKWPWSEYGSVVGNAVYAVENKTVLDLIGIKNLKGRGKGFESSDYVAFTELEGEVAYLEVTVINVEANNTAVGLAEVFVKVRTFNAFNVYRGVTNANGTAVIPVIAPVPYANITIYVRVAQMGKACYVYKHPKLVNIEPRQHYSILAKIPTDVVELPPPVSLRIVDVTVVNASKAPPEVVRSIVVKNVTYYRPLAFLKFPNKVVNAQYVLVAERDYRGARAVEFHFLDAAFNEIARSNMTPRGTIYRIFGNVTSVAYTYDGGFIAVATSDGMIYVFKLSNLRYLALASYRMPSKVVSMTFSDSVEGVNDTVALTVITEDGDVQVLAYTPGGVIQEPILRLNNALSLKVPKGGMLVAADPALNTVVVPSSGSLYVVRMLSKCVASHTPIYPDDVMAVNVELNVTRADTGDPVPNATIKVFMDSKELGEVRTGSNGLVEIPQMPKAKYVFKVSPPTGMGFLKNSTVVADLRGFNSSVAHIRIALKPREYRVVAKFKDPVTGRLVLGDVEVYVDGTPLATVSNGELNTTLTYGRHGVLIKPLIKVLNHLTHREEPLYIASEYVLVVNGSVETSLKLVRGLYAVTIKLIDEEDGGPIHDDAAVFMDGTSLGTYANGSKELRVYVPPGKHTLEVTSKLYAPLKTIINVSSDAEFKERLRRANVSVRVMVVDEDGKPLPGCHVNVTSIGTGMHTYVITGRDGAASLSVPWGLYRVCIHSPAIAPKCLTKPLAGGTITLTAKYRVFRLGLTVIDSRTGRKPLVTVDVYVDGQHVGSTRGGKPLIFNARYGRKSITLVPRAEINATLTGKPSPLYGNKTVVFMVVRDTNITVALERVYYNLTLTLIDSMTKKPPIDDLVLYVDGVKAATVAKGTESVSGLISRGVHEILVANSTMYTDLSRNVNVTKDGTVKLELKRRICTLTVKVVNDLDEALKGSEVVVLGITIPHTAAGVTDDSGLTSINLPYGRYEVRVGARGYYEYVESVTVKKPSVELEVRLRPMLQTVVMRVLPYVVVVAVIAVIAAVGIKVWRRVKAVMRSITEEEYF